MQTPFYNSRDEQYKTPFGAVCENTPVHFRILLPRAVAATGAFLVIHRDDVHNVQYLPMTWEAMHYDDHEWWEITFTPDTVSLYWYHFEYDTSYGRFHLYNAQNGFARLAGHPENFQLTVYSEHLQTPKWLRGGIIYQIFPDRFSTSGTKKENVPKNRVLRSDWGNTPAWRPDAHGEILNNDFFGGDLLGIIQKLPYLKSLGVTCIYLNPIVLAFSNHRYDTADYTKIDPLLGTREDFRTLCKTAKNIGINIMLDGVFSHTGADSIYFNIYKNYGDGGAYQDQNSPYYEWFSFQHWPDTYASWWGIKTLPEVKESNFSFIEYIMGKDGAIAQWLNDGAMAIRLDVADELPDVFLDTLHKTVKERNKDILILGEVWEDASNKYSYGHRRRYLLGDQLDSVMNYPFKDAILAYLISANANHFGNQVLQILENYPPQVIHILMNHIGTHDTVRAITALAGDPNRHGDREWQHAQIMTPAQYVRGIKLMKMASALQFTLPGVPSIYYGDEAGMQGYNDPFNRGCFPWGKENKELLSWYKSLANVRHMCPALIEGRLDMISSGNGCVAYVRSQMDEKLMIIVNRNETQMHFVLPQDWHACTNVLASQKCHLIHDAIDVPPMTVTLIGKGNWIAS